MLCLHKRVRLDLAVQDPLFGRRMVHMAGASDVSRLVQASASGDEAAWNELVRRYSPLVMAVTRNYRLTAADAQDVSQTVWLRLVENLASLRQPEALPGWLATTTQRECSRQVQRGRRVQPVDPHTDSAMQQGTTVDVDIEADILRAELRQALRDGLGELSARDQWLLRLRAADPPKSYAEISELLGMPIGSVGPTVRRSLDRLRETSAMRAYLAAAPTASRGTTSRGTGGDRRELAEVD
jgi:RNA polymerase sigma factor (sigma-70 family)